MKKSCCENMNISSLRTITFESGQETKRMDRNGEMSLEWLEKQKKEIVFFERSRNPYSRYH